MMLYEGMLLNSQNGRIKGHEIQAITMIIITVG